MPIIRDPEREELDRIRELEDRDWAGQQEALRRQHEYRLKKLSVVYRPRQKVVERILLAWAKAPALMLVGLMVAVIVLRGKEVPKVLSDFLNV